MDPEEAMIAAASALHSAANALNLCRGMLPQHPTDFGSGRTDMRPSVIIDPVMTDINTALDAIAAVIGEERMLEA